MWEHDEHFVAWLDEEELGTDENPLDDDTLELMYQAFVEGVCQGHRQCRKDDRAR